MFVPAWKWGAVNLLAAVAIIANCWLSRSQQSEIWPILRLLWALVAVVWAAINLHYWPLWLAQADRSVGNTLRNGVVLFLHAPGLSLLTLFWCLALVVLSALMVIPLVNWLMVWVASIGLFVTKEMVRQVNEKT